MARTGRPSKFTPEVRRLIVDRLQAGATIAATCDNVNISHQTFLNWLERGRKATSGEYFDFLEAVTRAQSQGLVHAAAAFRQGMNPSESVAVTTEAIEETRINPKTGEAYTYRKSITRRTVTQMPGDWRAAMEYLARRDPDNWARSTPQKIEHSGKVEITWQDKAIGMIQRGEMDKATALEVFDNNDELVNALFARAKVSVSVGETE